MASSICFVPLFIKLQPWNEEEYVANCDEMNNGINFQYFLIGTKGLGEYYVYVKCDEVSEADLPWWLRFSDGSDEKSTIVDGRI